MKKFFAVLLAALLLLSVTVAVAEGIDFSSMTDEELHALIDGARDELSKREPAAADGTVILDRDGVTVTLTGNMEIPYEDSLHLEVMVVNNSDKNIAVSMYTASINEWSVQGYGIGPIGAGKKLNDDLSFDIADTDITTVDEVNSIGMELVLFDDDVYEDIGDTTNVELNF